VKDLLGPVGGPEEEVEDHHVYERYLIGMLAPCDMHTAPNEQDNGETQEEGLEDTGPIDSGNAQTVSFSPSTMGMSFCVSPHITSIRVHVSWGHYQRTTSETRFSEKTGKPLITWKRTPRVNSREFTLYEGQNEDWRPAEEEQYDVVVRCMTRRTPEAWNCTLFLVNGQKKPKQSIDRAWLFQPELIVEALDGGPIFQRRPLNQHANNGDDLAMAMLYRRQVSFAAGHGVSVHAETLPGDPTCAVRLSTSFVPRYDVPLTEAPSIQELPALADLCLDMRILAESKANQLGEQLQPLITAYSAWIDEQARRLDNPTADLLPYKHVADKAIEHCRATLARIQAGIALLQRDPQAARAFTFMNRAMWQQRIRTQYTEEQRRGSMRTLAEIDQPVNRSWRPFQLAFILLSLPSLTDIEHPERSASPDAIADLLWFPTGGGKTEAYLGLTAYTLAIRRLQGTVAGRSGRDGIAVIMRYTLRLLTLQQFQRAAALICACEMIRREEGSATWGQTPFRLGLWVGQRATPNTTQGSADSVDQERHGSGGSGFFGNRVGTPRQLTHCPWCGAPIDGGRDIQVENFSNGRGRTIIYCGASSNRCPFNIKQSHGEGLPVLVVDEEIYRFLPGLLISTVDKFAQLPWKGETQMLFGQVNRHCERHGFLSPEIKDTSSHKPVGKWSKVTVTAHAPLRPPDLIIQDELHLISGPLGTMVGLYETAIDSLATWEIAGHKVRPKVVAATATIRQADNQIKALFMRNVNIFPPQGLDIKDNFFSRQRDPSPDKPGRRYLGICANGKRRKAADIRTYVVLLASGQLLFEKYGVAADPWMTLVGYFNAIRDLGGMRHIVDDDVRNRVWQMNLRNFPQRRVRKVQELTSRISTSDIPDLLSTLEIGFQTPTTPVETRPDKTDEKERQIQRPIDVLLATNMISVGVDVRRLGLMVVTGQPKTSAEYIQATSRVGRSHPGLVCVVYNWSRPRDLSHYEQFEHYHATFYQQVEALSVTPFAPRALDRGLAALLTSFVRLTDAQYNKNDSAGLVEADTPHFARAIDIITERAKEILPEASAYIRADLERLKAYWLQEKARKSHMGYETVRDGITLGLLSQPQQEQWQPFTCLNSMRNVEPSVHLILDDRPLSRGEEQEDDDDEDQDQENIT
jgi:hypothetical protein